jgi:hypothetical protein
MKQIGVALSKKQMSRLKNGHSVKVMEGEGILMVNPLNYDLMSKSFKSGRKPIIRLTPEEILANNRNISPEAHQETSGVSMLPKDSVIDKPATSNTSSSTVKSFTPIAGKGFVSNAGGTKTKFGSYKGNYLLASALGNADAGVMSERNIANGIKTARQNGMVVGMGMSDRHMTHKREVGYMRGKGHILGTSRESILPPALQSQPFSSSFNMASQLPPAFVKYHTSV